MKDILFTIVVAALLAGCMNDHVAQPVYHCDASQPISFTTISPIIVTKCAVSGCHDATNNYIPRLSNEQEVASNRADCKSQLLNGAMPPTSAASLTADEKAKILCWLGN